MPVYRVRQGSFQASLVRAADSKQAVEIEVAHNGWNRAYGLTLSAAEMRTTDGSFDGRLFEGSREAFTIQRDGIEPVIRR